MDNFCLPALELEHLKLEFYHETRVLEIWNAIFLHCFAKVTTNKIVKNLRTNGKKKKKKKSKKLYLRKDRQRLFRLHVFGFENSTEKTNNNSLSESLSASPVL